MKKSALVFFVFFLSGCSLFYGNTRTVRINAFSNSMGVRDPGGPITDALCSVSDDKKKIGYIISPGSITVDRSVGELFIVCNKEGYNEASNRIDISDYSTNEEAYILLTKE